MQPLRPRFITGIGRLAVTEPSTDILPVEPVSTLRDVWLEIDDGTVIRIGSEGEPVPDVEVDTSEILDVKGRLVTPGLVDAHTHPVFVGMRQGEFVRRCRGETYRQIAAAGGGILASVQGVRSAGEDELEELILRRLDRFLELGVTTIEAKSGYGLTLKDELKSLRALKRASIRHEIDVSPTLLGAHVIPPEYRNNPDRYVALVCDAMIPRAAEDGLAEAVDLFLEEGAFDLRQARDIFTAGREAGLMLRIHADQFTAGGGAQLAAEFGAASADHMDRTDDAGFQRLAAAGVTVVLLPGAVFFLGLDEYAPARRIIDSGCRIALSTDYNPGSSPTQSLPLIMTLACIKMGLTPHEALWAVTMGGAWALHRQDRIGTLQPGYQADICVWDADDVDVIPYRYGDMIPAHVLKKGTVVARRGCRIGM